MQTARIIVVGLGPGDPALRTVQVEQCLSEASQIWLRTGRHPSSRGLPNHILAYTFDDVYEQAASLDDVYARIAERLRERAAQTGSVLYGVPGDPMVGERSVQILLDAARPGRATAGAAGAVSVEILPGISFIQPVLAQLGWDAIDDLQITDASVLASQHHPRLDPDRRVLVAQMYDRLLASDVKLTLLNQYPPDHHVALVRAAGVAMPPSPVAGGEGGAEWMALEDLDRHDRFDDLTSLAIAPLGDQSSAYSLADIVAHLRSPDGCPWDREQTHRSLRPFLLEETYEVLAALDGDNPAALCEELGDLLLQVILHAQLAAEAGEFLLADCVRSITAKLIRRHPHVFGDLQLSTAAEVLVNWEELKRRERQGHEEVPVPAELPALARSQAIQQRVPPESRVASASRLAAIRQRLPALDSEAPSEAQAVALAHILTDLVAVAIELGLDAESILREATPPDLPLARDNA
jgi:tetrapyrrole methylase family protein/MazG family protein